MSEDVYRAPKGTHDILPPESEQWMDAIATFASRARRYGYGLVVTPIFEHVEVFRRVGASTDIVRKEMYEFEDKEGRHLALRPEGTATVVRAYVQHRPTPPWKVWYLAPHFRYEQPQWGRYRQHWQLGAEVMGVDDPDVDVEVIDLAHGFYRDLGLTKVRLLLNSMGDAASRPAYLDALRTYLLDHAAPLGPEFRERVEQNPLRVLDSKVEDWQDVIERAPQLTEYLGDEAAAYFERVQQGLDSLGIAHELAPRLVRGFDYYTSTTFEFVSDAIEAAHTAVGGGGRYDQLAEDMGGPPTPSIGFGIGIERMLLALRAELGDAVHSSAPGLDAFVIDAVGDGSATVLVAELRADGLRADRAYGGRSVKAQFKLADRSGAPFAVVLGRREAEHDAVRVKDLQSGEERELPRREIAGWLQAQIEDGRGIQPQETGEPR